MTRFRYILTLFCAVYPLCGSVKGENSLHWAYRPLVKPSPPLDNSENRGGNEIDRFLYKKYAELGITPTREADRHTLIRRLTINLTGLPPTVAEIENFLADGSPDAYETLANRLLDSPHYGERWGRHWLDVARYVQGKVKVPGVDRIDLAEEYRDYVVRAFNSDKPYDLFVTEQLAGDLLAAEDENKTGDRAGRLDRIAAPAFLSIGPWFDECTDPNKLKLDIADEQISTVTKAFLGLDFACCRCHDHKFDPIPTRDYYALAGIFRSTQIVSQFSEFWRDGRPRLTEPYALPGEIENARRAEKQIEKLQERRWAILTQKRREFISAHDAALREAIKAEGGMRQVKGWEAEDFSGHKNLVEVEGKYTPALQTRVALDRWVQYSVGLDEPGRFWLYIRYAGPQDAPVNLEINKSGEEERLPLTATGGLDYTHYRWEAFGPFSFRKGINRIRISVERHKPFPKLDAFKIVRSDAAEPSAALARAKWRATHSKTFWPPMIAEMELILPEEQLRGVSELDREIERLQPETALVETLAVRERSNMVEEAVRKGGEVYQRIGDPVPRGVPAIFPGLAEKYQVPPGQSGRLQLALWLTDPANPLTARVIVNRLWQWHFGSALVSAPDSFGVQSAPPVYSDLLDWLAAELIDSGWSVKHIQRLILTSQAYRRRSAGPDQSGESNPALLASFPRRRLEAEALYDGMLGTLTKKVRRQPSGQPLQVNLSKDRALYVLTSSRSPKGLGLEIRKMFHLFGFDPSGRPIHQRSAAATPDQSLWFLNNPLPAYYADKLAEELLNEGAQVSAEVLEQAFLTVMAKPPTEKDRKSANNYINYLLNEGLAEKESLARVILGLFSSEQFSFLY